MSLANETAAVLALAKATDKPWYYTSRAIQARGSALRLIDGDFTGLDEYDRAHASLVVSRLNPGDVASAEMLIAATQTQDTRLVTVLDLERYPGNLDFTYNFPPFLWVRGQLLTEDCRSIAIVSERTADHACEAAHALAQAGLTVVAGLRSDVDAAIHRAALAAGGRTIAVLAGGLTAPDSFAEYATVAQKIAITGALVSAFWPD